MSTIAPTIATNEEAFFRKRQAMLMFPLIVLPFIAVLFWLFKGGKGERYAEQEAVAGKPGSGGFNVNMPNAKGGSMDGRDVEGPGYGKAVGGQVLSAFSNTRQDSISRGLTAIPVSNTTSTAGTAHASSMATSTQSTSGQVATPKANAAALAATGSTGRRGKKYTYRAPQSGPYYTASATDQQLESQLQQYESARQAQTSAANTVRSEPTAAESSRTTLNPAAVRLSDNLKASRLAESADYENLFLTAPTGGSRTQPTRAVLSGGNYGSKKTVAWMIPIVVHEDQVIKEGQQVKLRLLKEVTAEGITIPANTILYAICQLSNDRLQLGVRSLQLNGQLIPLDLEVYDTDGSPGINVPGMASSSQMGGQMRSSAIQGVQVPGVGGLGNAVINSARMGASNSVRQSTIRLRAGYNLFLKA